MLYTNHFAVSISIIEWDESRVDGAISLGYTVVYKTTFATKRKVKKFLQRYIFDCIDEAIRSKCK